MRRSVSLLSLVAVGTLTGHAFAVMPNTPAAGPAAGVLEVKVGDAVRAMIVGTGATPSARASAWSKFQQLAGGTWVGLWDEVTGAPMAVHGSGIPAPGSVTTTPRPSVSRAPSSPSTSRCSRPGRALSDIHLVDNITDGEMRTLGFVQTHRGIEGLRRHLIFEFKNDRLFVVWVDGISRTCRCPRRRSTPPLRSSSRPPSCGCPISAARWSPARPKKR